MAGTVREPIVAPRCSGTLRKPENTGRRRCDTPAPGSRCFAWLWQRAREAESRRILMVLKQSDGREIRHMRPQYYVETAVPAPEMPPIKQASVEVHKNEVYLIMARSP